ncbi:MAG: hypothetical protein P4M05_05220, partial [Bradyrhizobium sp.]|nr:hypothetical protein [Bradyrhizobium sp.]
MSPFVSALLNLAIKAIGSVVGVFSTRAGEWWERQKIAPATGRTLSILVAKISGDNAANSNHHSIREAIRNAMGDGVSVIGWPKELPVGDGLDELAHKKSESLARKWLESKRCDLLISGRMKSPNVVSLRFTTLNQQQPSVGESNLGPQTYNLPVETMDFPTTFIDHLGAAIAASALANIRVHHQHGLAPAVRNVASQLAEITSRSTTALDVQVRARLTARTSPAIPAREQHPNRLHGFCTLLHAISCFVLRADANGKAMATRA